MACAQGTFQITTPVKKASHSSDTDATAHCICLSFGSCMRSQAKVNLLRMVTTLTCSPFSFTYSSHRKRGSAPEAS